MNTMKIDPCILNKVQAWLKPPYSIETQGIVQRLIDEDPQALYDAFYQDLSFGTGGLRGVMGTGTNRVNRYTVSIATQGLAYYLKQQFPFCDIKVVIAYDSRINSPEFAQVAAEVLSANHIDVYLFEALRPTPELSFAIRELGCQSGIVITASHNPKEYNGYKVYWEDGGQLVAPHDEGVIGEVQKLDGYKDVQTNSQPNKIHFIGNSVDDLYLERVNELVLNQDAIHDNADLSIVYTPLHGTGGTLLPKALKQVGFNNVHVLEEQAVPDGEFPTVSSPNPEESEALQLALEKGQELDATLVMGTDPDSDRIGIAIRNAKQQLVLLNGNQTAALLVYYQLNQWQVLGKLNGNQFIAKTIVTTPLLNDIAAHFGVDVVETLTGFKFIAEAIQKESQGRRYIVGGEESYGYLVGDFVRDKDAIGSGVVIAEIAAWAAQNRQTLYGLLTHIYSLFGVYQETLVSVTLKGAKGQSKIKSFMDTLRKAPPKTLYGKRVESWSDYQRKKRVDVYTNIETDIFLPCSNVIQLHLEGGTCITARPSGTEPKIKFYGSSKTAFKSQISIDQQSIVLKEGLESMISELKGAI